MSGLRTWVLVGNPNCGKTALFNALTGSRQRVANYAGVTVERKEGVHTTRKGKTFRVVDLPGIYGLSVQSPDEVVAREAMTGKTKELGSVDGIVALVDATNLDRSLGLVLELKGLGKPMVVACNMMDLAVKRGLDLDLALLEKELGVPVVATVATKSKGLAELVAAWDTIQEIQKSPVESVLPIAERFQKIDEIIQKCTRRQMGPDRWTHAVDRVLLHPVAGLGVLGFVLLGLFQAVFQWAAPFQDALEAMFSEMQAWAGAVLGSGPLSDLVTQGVIAGVGAVLVFLPQILILFLLILFLEDSGYLARAAFLLDRMMARFGLSGRSVIPLLGSFACAIPGVMATRTISSRAERMTTLLVAPLTTCSARLPVYTMLVSTFVPDRMVGAGLGLRGLVMFGLYGVGIIAPLVVAWVFRRTLFSGESQVFLLELPSYKWPSPKDIALGLLQRASGFIQRAGTVILSLSILIWFLSTYPRGGTITDSYAGILGKWMEPLLAPLGFDWRIALGLIPGMAAREVMLSALTTIYAIEQTGEAAQTALSEILSQQWSFATAMSLLVWFAFAPQCISTLAVIRRETHSLRWPAFAFFYMATLAYGFSWITYRAFLGWEV